MWVEILHYCAGTGPLDVRIKRLAGQRDDLQDTVRRLKLDFEEERSRNSSARGTATAEEMERWAVGTGSALCKIIIL